MAARKAGWIELQAGFWCFLPTPETTYTGSWSVLASGDTWQVDPPVGTNHRSVRFDTEQAAKTYVMVEVSNGS